MNISSSLAAHDVPDLPLRAWLSQLHDGSPTYANPAWKLNFEWTSQGIARPLLGRMQLRSVVLEGNECCALACEAFTLSGGDEVFDDELCAVVFLLNPADISVWEAIESWTQGKMIHVSGDGCSYGRGTGPAPDAVFDLKLRCGQELESDILAGSLLTLLQAHSLERTLARQLDVTCPLYCAIVDTPMMAKSLEPVDAELWRMHLEHRKNMLRNQDCAE